MHMLTRRLQVLIDEGRYARLSAEAARTNLSVGEVVRRALDRALPSTEEERERAFEMILNAPQIEVPDPEELRAELDEIRSGGL